MEGSETLTTPQDNEIVTLTHSIIEWRRLKEESDSYRQQLKERSKKMKVLEEVILRVMKSNNIGALDLKSSGGRVLYKKQKRQAGLGQKNMMTLMAAALQSETKATEVMKYIQEHREVVTKESIAYEKSE
jgi:predicted GNAT family N-acyltransferase